MKKTKEKQLIEIGGEENNKYKQKRKYQQTKEKHEANIPRNQWKRMICLFDSMLDIYNYLSMI